MGKLLDAYLLERDVYEEKVTNHIAEKLEYVCRQVDKEIREEVVENWYSEAGASAGIGSMNAATDYFPSLSRSKGMVSCTITSEVLDGSYNPLSFNESTASKHGITRVSVLHMQTDQGFIGLPGEWCRHFNEPLESRMASAPEWYRWGSEVEARL